MTGRKRTFLFIALSLLVTAAVLFLLFSRREPYNRDPDLSGKMIPTGLPHTEYRIPTTIENLIYGAEVVLIATVTNDRVCIAEKEPGPDPSPILCAEMQTEKVLTVTPSEFTFLLRQEKVGPKGEPFVRTGDRLLLILQKREDYYETSVSGAFILDEENRLTSLSPFMICARYDGLHLRTFERDLKKSYFYHVIGDASPSWDTITAAYQQDETFRQKRLDEWNDLTDGKPLDYEYPVIERLYRQQE
ncbi:MAG: hypothetical protein IKM31_05560 [Oscillospiraceae bacterium]|nr:hypothetical protein [Oscillospiraceae bacterium]